MPKEDKEYRLLKKIVHLLSRRNWLAMGITDAVNILQARGVKKDDLMVVISTTDGDYIVPVEKVAFSEAGTSIYIEETKNEIIILNTAQITNIVVKNVG